MAKIDELLLPGEIANWDPAVVGDEVFVMVGEARMYIGTPEDPDVEVIRGPTFTVRSLDDARSLDRFTTSDWRSLEAMKEYLSYEHAGDEVQDWRQIEVPKWHLERWTLDPERRWSRDPDFRKVIEASEVEDWDADRDDDILSTDESRAAS